MGKKRSYTFAGYFLLIVFLEACTLFSPKATPVSSTSPVAPTASAPTDTVPASASPLGSLSSGACANDYYPVPSGATWSYSSTGSTSVGDYTYTRTVSTVSDTGFTTTDQFSTGVNAAINWTCQNGNLAALDAGSTSFTMTTAKIKMTSDSVTADGHNIPASFAAGNTWSENVMVKGTVTNASSKSVNSQIAAQLTCTAAGPDQVSVPAGDFATVKANCSKTVVVSALVGGKTTQLASNHEDITYWYARGVGYIKSVATGGTDNETIVLTSYKIK